MPLHYWNKAYRSGVAYTRCGVMLFGLEPDQPSWNMDTAVATESRAAASHHRTPATLGT
jgi:hypothetical protein